MKWKPDETDIVDYLYGAMTTDNKEKFEAYLKLNPELQQEINDLRMTQEVLPSLDDEEVIPYIPFTNSNSIKLKSSRYWLMPVSIAASIAIILLVGYLTDFRMSFNSDGFQLAFKDQSNTVKELNELEIEQMIASEVEQYATRFDQQFESLAGSFEAQLNTNQALTEQQIKQVADDQTSVQLDESQVLGFIAQLQEENKKMMQNFYQVNAEEQKTYMRNILLEYSDYLDNQRKEDLQFIQANLLDIKSNSAMRQEETDKILANIISTVNNQNSPNNDRLSLD